MPHYLLQVAYTPEAWANMVKNPQNREDAVSPAVQKLGGAIVVPAEDTPYGRLATATDPTGAPFKLVAPNEAMPARDPSS